ncbi:hypothetical protein [Pseudomonas sp. NPDC089569]|uniref:hypothetical protein n=1 Tax=Pseudomonas sp. NPDC089569 TaxID=3390722 RepID=UPI003CFFD454
MGHIAKLVVRIFGTWFGLPEYDLSIFCCEGSCYLAHLRLPAWLMLHRLRFEIRIPPLSFRGRIFGYRRPDLLDGNEAMPTPIPPAESLEKIASQAAKELGAVLAIGDELEPSDIPIIRGRLNEVIEAVNAAIRACEDRQSPSL